MGLGKRLKDLRKKLGFSQAQMAKQLNIALSSYQYYEREEREPSAGLLQRIVTTFEVNPTWLLTGEGPMFLNEIPQIPGIEDDEREILRILREYPELKPKILKLLKGIRTVDEAMEEIKTQTSMSLETPLTTQK